MVKIPDTTGTREPAGHKEEPFRILQITVRFYG
jgi:hypothetical protein